MALDAKLKETLEQTRDLVRIGVWLTVIEFAILMVLVPFYWPLIGIH